MKWIVWSYLWNNSNILCKIYKKWRTSLDWLLQFWGYTKFVSFTGHKFQLVDVLGESHVGLQFHQRTNDQMALDLFVWVRLAPSGALWRFSTPTHDNGNGFYIPYINVWYIKSVHIIPHRAPHLTTLFSKSEIPFPSSNSHRITSIFISVIPSLNFVVHISSSDQSFLTKLSTLYSIQSSPSKRKSKRTLDKFKDHSDSPECTVFKTTASNTTSEWDITNRSKSPSSNNKYQHKVQYYTILPRSEGIDFNSFHKSSLLLYEPAVHSTMNMNMETATCNNSVCTAGLSLLVRVAQIWLTISKVFV